MEVVVWTSSPTHHQSGFFDAIRAAGVTLRVVYCEGVSPKRIALGWKEYHSLPAGETYVKNASAPLEDVANWRTALHVVTGYSTSIFRTVARTLARTSTEWVHWSEPAQPGLRWFVSYPVKWWYAQLVNCSALGAFAIGEMARQDFVRWGIEPSKIAELYYVLETRCDDADADIDTKCRDFLNDASARFIVVGSLCRRKATDVILKAFAQLVSRFPSAKLILVGNDLGSGQYQELARRLAIANNVLFRGVVPAENLASVIKACSVLILASRFDGWGVPLNEGATHGLALIGSTRTGSAFHLVHPGVNGFRVRAGSVSSLVPVLNAYASTPELVLQHGAASVGLSKGYSPEANVQRFLRSIQSWRAMRRLRRR
jgi:glycosyltransferase involved in cell wall biosynthesis